MPAAQRAGTGWSRGLRRRPARLPRPLEFVTCKRQAIGIKGRGIAFICRLRFGSRRAERADLTKHVGLVRQEHIQVGTHQVDDSCSGHTCPKVLVVMTAFLSGIRASEPIRSKAHTGIELNVVAIYLLDFLTGTPSSLFLLAPLSWSPSRLEMPCSSAGTPVSPSPVSPSGTL